MNRRLVTEGWRSGLGRLLVALPLWAGIAPGAQAVRAPELDQPSTAGATSPDFRILWKVELEGWAHMMIIRDGVVYSQWSEGLFSAVDLHTGEVLRTTTNVAYMTAPFIVGDRIYSYRPGQFNELSRETFELLRQIVVPDGAYAENFPYDPATDAVFVRRSSPEGYARLSALGIESGESRWTTDFWIGPAAENAGSPLFVGDDSVYLQGADGTNWVWRLDKQTGAVRWVRPVGLGRSAAFNNMIYDRKHDAIYGSTLGNVVFALRRTDGGLLWSRELPHPVQSTLTYHRGILYVPLWNISGPGACAALDVADGRPVWMKKTFFEADGWSAMAVDDRYLYRNTHSGGAKIVVQDRLTGDLVWSADAGANQPCTNPVQSDGIVVFGNERYLVALKAGRGTPVDCAWHGVNATGYNPGAIVWKGQASEVDEDQDQLPDAWELRVFGHLMASGADDEDGDGATNYAEYVAGTSCLDAGDVFRLRLSPAGGKLRFAFPSQVTGRIGYEGLQRHYAVVAADQSPGGTWEPLAGFERLPGTGTDITGSLPLDGRHRLLRVDVWLAPGPLPLDPDYTRPVPFKRPDRNRP